MSGSPRAVRHLAARLSADLGVAVVTPTLRLAPEHPYPAALEDLTKAYQWVERHGVVQPGDGDAGALVRGAGRQRLRHKSLPARVATRARLRCDPASAHGTAAAVGARGVTAADEFGLPPGRRPRAASESTPSRRAPRLR